MVAVAVVGRSRCQRCSGLLVGHEEPSCINCGATPLTQREIDSLAEQVLWDDTQGRRKRRSPNHGGLTI